MEKAFLAKGSCDCKIVIPCDAHIVEKTAAEELVNYIEKALSVKLPTVRECEADGKCIYVGHTEYAKKNNVIAKSKENWIIKMVGGNLVLTGGTKQGERGTIYSVYHFLEDVVGVRWWNPYEEDILALDSLELAEDFYKEGTPHFSYRKPLMDSGFGVEVMPHLARTRTNVVSPLDDNIPDGVYDENVRKYGDVLTMGRPHHVHTMGKFFPASEYFDEHPDWWAWNNAHGKHLKEGHRCFSNEGFFNALLEKLLGIIKEDVELAEKTGVELPDFYSISMDDLMGYCFCECPECTKILKEAGRSGYVIKFINRLAREVKKVYPWVKLETLAYLEYIELPKDGTLPDENVIIRLADVYIDLIRGPHHPINKQYLSEITAWGDYCKKAGCGLYVWDYHYNIVLNAYPLFIFERLKDTVKTFADCGVTGVFTETQNKYTDAWELTRYLLCHLLEDPDLDEKALIYDFTERYYGRAAKLVREYFELIQNAAEKNPIHAYCCDEDSPFNYMDFRTAIEADRILSLACAEVEGEYLFAERVDWLRRSVDTAILIRFFDFKKNAADAGEEFNFDILKVRERVIDAYNAHLETPYGKNIKSTTAKFLEYIENLPTEEEKFDIPEELADVPEEDIYQFPLKDMVKFTLDVFEKGFGCVAVNDGDKRVLKVSYDAATGSRAPYALYPTSKYAENTQALVFELRHGTGMGAEVVEQRKFYREDINLDGYNLYKIGSISGIKDSFDAKLGLPEEIGVSLKGISTVFPMDACDVYLLMKFTGEIHGGNPEDENAFFIDRAIIVRK